MAASARSALLCPCLARWLPSARASVSVSSRQWTDRFSASNRPRTASSDSTLGFVSECGVARRNGFPLLGRSEKYLLYEGRRAFQIARLTTRSCASYEDKAAKGLVLDRNAEGHELDLDRTATGLISHIVEEPAVSELPKPSPEEARKNRGRKRMCYYFSQGLCTLMEDEQHLSRFSHEYPDMSVRAKDLEKVKPQPFSHLLVLDLEGMVEILEFPVIMVDAKTLQVVDRFHRFVRPAKMTQEKIEDYIRNKYGKWGLDRVWHDTAIPFTDVLPAFEGWLKSHGFYDPETPSKLTTAAFVTCGNWDVKTKIPEQCVTSGIDLPPYFNEWINLKDIYFNFYKFRAGGMLAMMKGLKMPMEGTHHVGLDDAHNIARVLQRMLAHGAKIQITAKRKAGDRKAVKFTFRFRIK